MEEILVLNNDDDRRCVRCGRSLPISGFYRSRKSVTSLQHWCKDCQRSYAVRRRNYIKLRMTEFSAYTVDDIASAIENADTKTLKSYKSVILKLAKSIDSRLEEQKRSKRKNLR